ncbi:MAG TPA: glucose 1-dehydrogenase [Alphaproteobacteria bacterium]|jgi:NAD(P)-dependent dehydrogenase (short-subunit alcohol dehydrogenase family)|nr:glucose 1-dehydrogenase [Alphaproteobacteria bacterium]
MEITLKGKVALVTGGGAGIGKAIVEAYGALGAKIAVAEIDAGKVEALNAGFKNAGIDGIAIQADVQNTDDVKRVIAEVDAKFGRLDVLVNNAGHHLYKFSPLDVMEEADMDALYNINLRQLFIVTKHAIPLMKRAKAGGSVINVSSIEGFRGSTYNIAYTAFKHGVTGFTRGLALELAHEQIRVNTIAPETTETEQVAMAAFMKPQYRDQPELAARSIPLGRFGHPSDHAGAAVYLATDLSLWVTGTTIHVDGGGLAAGGMQRLPDGGWTVTPIVTDTAMGG